MKYASLKPGMKIRAIGPWSNCWKVGDEFVVTEDRLGWWHRFLCLVGLRQREFRIACHDNEYSDGGHGLSGTATDDGDLPEFEPA